MATINATYKRRNGDAWDDIYFKTSAGQVGVSSSRKFVTTSTKVNNVAFTLDSSGDGASVTLYAGDIKMSSSDSTTLATKIAALQNLDGDLTAIAGLTGTSGFLKKTAANTWALDTTVLTSGNYSTTLGSVYQGKNDNLTSLAGLSTSSTGLVKFTNGVASLDSTSYATTSAIANMVTASSNLATNKIVIGKANNKTVETSTYSVGDIVEIAEGRTKTYITTLYTTNNKKYLCFGDDSVIGEEVISDVSDLHTVEITSSTNSFELTDDYTYFYSVKYDSDNERYIVDGDASADIGSLKKGDIILITDLEYPDFWIYEDGNFFVSKLETTKQDLSPYLTAVSYDSSSHKITYTKSSGSTDVVDLDNFASLNNSTGEISIGGVSKTPLYSHKYRAIKVAGTQQISDSSNTALNFLNSGNVTFTWDSTNTGVKASVDLSSYATKASPTFTGTITMPFSSAGFVKTNASGVLSVDTTTYLSSIPSDYHKIYYSASSSAPSSPSTGDFWIATS